MPSVPCETFDFLYIRYVKLVTPAVSPHQRHEGHVGFFLVFDFFVIGNASRGRYVIIIFLLELSSREVTRGSCACLRAACERPSRVSCPERERTNDRCSLVVWNHKYSSQTAAAAGNTHAFFIVFLCIFDLSLLFFFFVF